MDSKKWKIEEENGEFKNKWMTCLHLLQISKNCTCACFATMNCPTTRRKT